MANHIKNNVVFDNEFYSSSQMCVYIGDVFVDEITSLSYQLQQMKRPLYGYASQLWDDCAAGQVHVVGNFTINFKEQGYLWAVLRRYKKLTSLETGVPSRHDDRLLKVRKGSRVDMPDLVRNGTRVGSNGTAISRATIERIANGEITRGERFNFYNDLAGYSTFNVNDPKDKVFEDIVEAFEDQIWEPQITNTTLNSQARRADDNIFDGFDIYLVFGDYSNPRANHTVCKITDVRIQGSGKQVQVDGMPIQEMYEFIARSVV